jgi:glycerophosphoryl diester phosphodiesterase
MVGGPPSADQEIRMRRPFRIGATIVAAAAVTLTVAASASTATPQAQQQSAVTTPTIFGHRGAAGYRPEHTSAGYTLGAQLGADYLEPDLVPTKDGYLVDRHEPEISQTTDVADHPEFAGLKTTKTIDGVKTTGWFTTDFTLAQLRTLRAKERIPDIRQHNTLYDGRYRIPTFQDDIKQVESLSKKLHRTIGIVPEIKHSTYFRSIGLPMEQRVLDVLHHYHLDGAHPVIPVVIQSFEVHNLQWLHARTRIPLLQLTAATGAPADFVAAGNPRTYADICTAAGLKQVAKYATYLGPDKNQIVPRTPANRLGTPTTVVRDAHRARLRVTPYTFRNENSFLPADYQHGTNPADYGDAIAEYELFYSLGVDGLFSDDSDTAVIARSDWIAKGRPHVT